MSTEMTSGIRKPDPRAKLKTLPPERQEEIFEYLRTHSTRETQAWLAKDELHVSLVPIKQFYHWYQLTTKLGEAASMSQVACGALREMRDLNLNEEQLGKAGQAIFEAQALDKGDTKLFVALRQLRQQDRSLDLQEKSRRTSAEQKERQLAQRERDLNAKDERWSWTTSEKVYECARDPKTRAIVDDNKMSRAEKIAAIRNAYFADVDAEEVILPP
jgi:hypothetical protein